MADLRSSVRMEIHERLPQVLEEAMQSKASELKKLLDSSAQVIHFHLISSIFISF